MDHSEEDSPGQNPEVAILTPTPPHVTVIPGGNDPSARMEEAGAYHYAFPSQDSLSSSNACKKQVKKKFPILKWLPQYRVQNDLLPDVVSGVTVGLTAIPQSMAYANVAGLTPEYGLYSSFVSCFVYLFLGSCRQMTIGPTALMELLVYETCGADFPSCVILVGFWVGVIQFIMGLLKLGVIVSLISDPVTIGFVAGASLTISSSQIKSFLGLSGSKGSGFLGYIEAAIKNIGTITVGDTCLGFACVAVLLLFKNLKDYWKPSTDTTTGKVLAKVIWFLSIGRNALVVICASVIAASLSDPPFALTGTVKSGFPPVQPPEFELPNLVTINGTGGNTTVITNGTLTFWETWGEISTAPLMISIVSILQNVAIAKAFGSGQSIDATQEMIALGISHICASFFSAMPTAGSFTRSAVNEASGVKSPIGGIFTGLLVIFALSFLTRWFAYIPKASLAAVILCAVLPMIEYEAILPMWKVSKLDVLTALITFLASVLLGMEYGIIIGVGVSLVFYLLRPLRVPIAWSIETVTSPSPTDKVPSSDNTGTSSSGEMSPLGDNSSRTYGSDVRRMYHLLKPEQGFMFPSVDTVRTFINKLSVRFSHVRFIVLDCSRMVAMDYTSATALASLFSALKKTGKTLVFVHCHANWIEMMNTVGLKFPKCYNDIRDFEQELRDGVFEK